MKYTLAATAVMTGLCACHSSRPATEVRDSESIYEKQVEVIDYRLLVNDSLALVIDSPRIHIVEGCDSSPTPIRAITVSAKSLKLQRVNSVDNHAESFSERNDSVCIKTERTAGIPTKSKSTAILTIAALFASIILILIAYKLRKYV